MLKDVIKDKLVENKKLILNADSRQSLACPSELEPGQANANSRRFNRRTNLRPSALDSRKLALKGNLFDKLIVALDVNSQKKAQKLVDMLYPQIKFFKVGLQLFTACGDRIVRYIKRKGAKVFLDLKFFDIPNTVANACREVVCLNVSMFTIHTQGGFEMMKQAKEAVMNEAYTLRIKPPLIIGVTVLTSEDNKGNILSRVVSLAKLAKKAGLDGIVCSAKEAKAVRKKLGKNFIIVTPGIRLPTYKKQDQKRTATPKEAIKSGSDYLVVGRPILEAKDPLRALELLLNADSRPSTSSGSLEHFDCTQCSTLSLSKGRRIPREIEGQI